MTMKRKLLFFLTAVVLVWSCSKGNDPIVPTYNNTIKSFVINAAQNSGMDSDALVVKIGDILYITVDEGVSLTSLIPTIESGEGTTFYIDDKPVDSGVTAVDLTKTAKLALVSEDGEANIYYICAKNGDKLIDNEVYGIMKQYDIPGISVSATKNETIKYSYGYGFANVQDMERTTPQHLFRLASVSKTQTSIAIMTLVERGKLKLSDRLFGKGGIFETEIGTEGLVANADQVTIKHLLEHTSGWSGEHIFTESGSLSGSDVLKRMKYVVHNIPMTHPLGTKYDYYNMGFGLLGCVIEKISGMDYEEFMRKEIYAPLGVTDIWVGKDLVGRRKNECVYYSQDGKNGYGNNMYLIRALGGLIASTEELMKVVAGVDYGEVVPDILKPATLDLMYKPSSAYNRYALGWRVNYPDFPHWSSYHGGTLAGTGTLLVRDKSRNAAAVILCNSRSYKDGFDDRMYELLDFVMDRI